MLHIINKQFHAHKPHHSLSVNRENYYWCDFWKHGSLGQPRIGGRVALGGQTKGLEEQQCPGKAYSLRLSPEEFYGHPLLDLQHTTQSRAISVRPGTHPLRDSVSSSVKRGGGYCGHYIRSCLQNAWQSDWLKSVSINEKCLFLTLNSIRHYVIIMTCQRWH